MGFRFVSELGGSSRWLEPGAWSESQGCWFSVLPAHRRAHRQYLLNGLHHDFPSYRSVVHEVTQAFAAASREVLAVEAELAGPRAQPVLARHVRSLQELEQTRLATVRPPPLLQSRAWATTHSQPPRSTTVFATHLGPLPLVSVCLHFPPRFLLNYTSPSVS